jgi:hypothetical protein
MDKKETAAIMSILQAAYPRFYINQTEEDMTTVLNLWSTMFADNSAKVVTEAVKALLTTLKYPPTIADVKEKILLLTRPPDMTEVEAWNQVYKAIQSANYNSQENFDKLPPILQRLVGSPNQLREWAQMDADTLKSVVSSNFNRSYTARVKQEKEYQILPQTNKDIIKSLADKFNTPELEEGKELNHRMEGLE